MAYGSYKPGEGFESYETNANLASSQYYIVKMGSTGKAVLAAAATDEFIGTLGYDIPTECDGTVNATTTFPVPVASDSERTYKVKLGGTVSYGDYLTSDAAGKAVQASSGNNYIGVARADGVTGDVIAYIKRFGQIN